jgi:Acetyltransferase (GNAT) family
LSPGPARIEIVPFAPVHLPAVARFSELTWNRPRTDRFYRWRYLESPSHRAVLALRGEEIVAMISAFQREYRFGSDRRTCLETLDWYCSPELRGSGLGVRVLQALMKGEEPIIAIGGTTDTLALLPRLGWRKMTSATCHRLPLHQSAVSESLRRRFGIPPWAGGTAFNLLGRPWFAPRVRQRPRGGQARAVPSVGEEIFPLYEGETGYQVLPLPSLPHLRWLTGGIPEAGRFVILQFLLEGELRGWTLLRIHGSENQPAVTLVEAYAPRPSEALYEWMISESMLRAAEYHPMAVDTQTSCPILRQALRRNRFLDTGLIPVHVWPSSLSGALEPVHLVCNASDGALFPYPAVDAESVTPREP